MRAFEYLNVEEQNKIIGLASKERVVINRDNLGKRLGNSMIIDFDRTTYFMYHPKMGSVRIYIKNEICEKVKELMSNGMFISNNPGMLYRELKLHNIQVDVVECS